MKTTFKITQMIAVLFLFAAISFTSCNKEISDDNSLTPEEETQASEYSSESDAEAEDVFSNLFDDVMGVNDEVGMSGLGIFGQKAQDSPGELNRTTACFTVIINRLNTPNVFPVEIVIDFGSGCVGRDGKTRSGKIKTTYTNRMVVPGAKATTVFDGYKVNDISVQGTHVITNTSTSDVRQFTVVIEDAKLSNPNGNYSEWNSRKKFTQIHGLGTPNFPHDDIFKIEGSASGKVKRGNVIVAWQNEITEPLIKKFSCRWIVKGTVKTWRRSSASTSPWIAVLDYGDVNCDNKATITINGVTKEISLR